MPPKHLSPPVTPAHQSRGRSRSRQKTLSPDKDPFLMPPEVLKEAVFKLCVAKLKKEKVLKKNVDPANWLGEFPGLRN